MRLKNKLILLLFISSVFLGSCNILSKNKSENKEPDLRTRNFNFNSYLLEGARQKSIGNYEAALKNYSFALRIDDKEPAVYYEMAGILSILGDYSAALEYAEEAVNYDIHNNIFYRVLLASLYKGHNMLSKAISTFEELIKIDPTSLEYYYEVSDLYFATGNVKKAIKAFDRAEKQFGITDFISLEKERIYRLTGKTDKAVKEIQKLADSNPSNAKYQILLAESYISAGSPEKALHIYEQIDIPEIDNGLIYFSIADFYRVLEKFDKTFEFLQKGFGAHDVDLDIKIKMMINLVSVMGHDLYIYKNALELMDILLTLYPEDVKVRTLYTDFLVFDDKLSEAQEEFNFILKQEKSNFTLWEQALFIDNHLGDFSAMYIRSKESLLFFPNQPVLYLFHTISAFQTENYQDVIDVAKKANAVIINNNEMLAQILTFQAESYRKLNLHKESDAIFEIVLSINPEDSFVLNNYSYYLALRGENLDKALEMSSRLVKINDKSASYLDTYAWVLYKSGDFDKALIYIDKALAINKDNVVHLEHKGDILYKLLKKDEALEYWQRASALGEGSEFLKQKIIERTLIE